METKGRIKMKYILAFIVGTLIGLAILYPRGIYGASLPDTPDGRPTLQAELRRFVLRPCEQLWPSNYTNSERFDHMATLIRVVDPMIRAGEDKYGLFRRGLATCSLYGLREFNSSNKRLIRLMGGAK